MKTNLVVASRSAPLPLRCPIHERGGWGSENCRVGTRARPSDVAVTAFAQGWTCGAASASWMTVVSAKTSSQLLLTQLLWLVQSDDDGFLFQDDAIHRVHRGCCLIWRLERNKTKSPTVACLIAHHSGARRYLDREPTLGLKAYLTMCPYYSGTNKKHDLVSYWRRTHWTEVGKERVRGDRGVEVLRRNAGQFHHLRK